MESRPSSRSAGAAVRPTLSCTTSAVTLEPSDSSMTCSPPLPARAFTWLARTLVRTSTPSAASASASNAELRG
jgi:hypothetical protein